MAEKKKFKKTKRKQNRVTVLCAVLCFALLLTFGDRCLTVMQVCSDIRKAEARLCEVNTDRIELEEALALMENKDHLAALAREELGYIYPGEEIWLNAKVSPDILQNGAEKEDIEIH